MPKSLKPEKTPPGFKLRHTLRGHESWIGRIAWSPDGRILASPSKDKTIKLWDAATGKLIRTLKGHTNGVYSVTWSSDGEILASGAMDKIRLWNAKTGQLIRTLEGHTDTVSIAWSPNGEMLASGPIDYTIRLWNTETGKLIHSIERHTGMVYSVAWSPDGEMLASGSNDKTIKLWNAKTGKLIRILEGHADSVISVAWSPSGDMLVSGSSDHTIRFWNVETGKQKSVLEGHTIYIEYVSFLANGRLLGSKSHDGTVRLWHCDTWETVAILEESTVGSWPPGLAFHPHAPVLATLGEEDKVIRIWDLDVDLLLGMPIDPSIHYTNAKAVLLGESSTGKTCLARALMGKTFEPQPSTHGMKVWDFKSEIVPRPDGGKINREIFLWDLAGQVDYQVVHQLFLDETAVGVVLFDPTDPEDPFGGVGHWEKALQRIAGESCRQLLVAGRVDRGHPTVTNAEIKQFCQQHNFCEYIATSANTGVGVAELKAAIARFIPWDNLPVTTSPQLWKDIREYLLERRKSEEVLSRRPDLRESFSRKQPQAEFSVDEFDTVIGHAQAQGLVWRLSFGDFVLLKPEFLNDYASAIVRVARKHPEGLGCTKERDVLQSKIDFEDLDRLSAAETERSLLHAVVELALEREVALREGEFLVFPSKFNRKRPEYPQPPLREVAYRFDGTIENIYATLVVRLFYCGVFGKKAFWKNAAEFNDEVGKNCGFVLSNPEEGVGEISIFFEQSTHINSKLLFLRFIHEHLQRRSLPDSLKRERVYRCPDCGNEVENKEAIQFRLDKGKKTITCQFCDKKIKLIDLLEEKFGDPELLRRVRELEVEVDERRDREVGITQAKAKISIGEFDIFMAHNSKDKSQVITIAEALKTYGINPWLDVEQIPPGRWFQKMIQQEIYKVKSAAIIVGLEGLGKWEIVELRAFLQQCVENEIPVIPVLLPGVTDLPKDLLFLRQLNWVQFKETVEEREALDNLVWGIRGEHPRRGLR